MAGKLNSITTPCPVCGREAYSLIAHHLRYGDKEREETLQICPDCHTIIHNLGRGTTDISQYPQKLQELIQKERDRLSSPHIFMKGKAGGVQLENSLILGWKINDAYVFDGFFGMVVEGRQRLGKSSYCSQGLAEAHGEWEHDFSNKTSECVKKNWEQTKKWIVFPPEEFIDITLSLGVGTKERGILWDDAGFWLFALDWYEPFVKTVARYIQLAGRQFGCLMLTSPSQKLISSKILEALPEIYVARIVKESHDSTTRLPRIAKVYERWDYPDGKKGGVRTQWMDHYNAILPEEFWQWYKPKSDHYLDEGLRILKSEAQILRLKQTKKERAAKDEEGSLMEKVYDVTGSPERLAEVNEVIAQLSATKAGQT